MKKEKNMQDRPKTVMLYLNSLHKGGAERVFAQLAGRFAEDGYRTILVTSYTDQGREEYPLSDRVERVNMEPVRPREVRLQENRIKRNLSRIARLRGLCRQYKPALLITCMQEPNFRGMLATMGLKTKNLVSVCSAPEMEYPGRLGRFVGKVLMPMAEGCVFQTEEEKRWFPEKLQKKSRIIMNQVSERFFDTAPSGERHDIVNVGRLNEAKNQSLLIRAFARIAGETEDNLRIYGAGELEEELRALIDSLNMEGRVRLMGLSADVPNAIKNARVFAFSSNYEGLPNALLEAMALGLPCVSTNCRGGGPAMVMQDGVNGLLVPPGDEEALAAAILRLLKNPAEAESLGAAARKTAEGFRPETVFAQWRDYAEELMHG